jgi:hypothetical protein
VLQLLADVLVLQDVDDAEERTNEGQLALWVPRRFSSFTCNFLQTSYYLVRLGSAFKLEQ